MIAIACECGELLEVPESFVGESAPCPACRAIIRIAARASEGQATAPCARLIIRSGLEGIGEQLMLVGNGPLEIGRLADKEICLAGSRVSISHCRLQRTPSGWRAEDLASFDGVYVNGMRIAAHVLGEGDVLRIGEYELVYHGHENAGPKPDWAADTDVNGVVVPLPDERTHNQQHEGPEASEEVLTDLDVISDDADGVQVLGEDELEVIDDDAPEQLYGMAKRTARRAVVVAVPRPAPAVRPSVPCPSCEKLLPGGARICVDCGIRLPSGRPLLTSQGVDEDALYDNSKNVVRAISFLIPFGLFPIASEAYGSKKPLSVWGIALATVMASILFWIVTANTSAAKTKTLMLWGGRTPSASDIEGAYARTDLGDADAYAAKIADLKDTVPKEQLPQAAFNALPPDQRCFEVFHPWQLFTHVFLHGGIMHLAGNLVFLIVLGTRVNAVVGNAKTVAIYPLLGIGAALAHLAASSASPPVPMLGASGAIMGLAGMYLVLFPLHRIHMTVWLRMGILTGFRLLFKVWALRGFWVVLFYIAFDVFATAVGSHDSVAHWAHLGGFLAGMAVAFVLIVTRLLDSHGSDLLSVTLGKYAWPLMGTPAHRKRRADRTFAALVSARENSVAIE